MTDGLVERLAKRAGQRPGCYPHPWHRDDARWWLNAIAGAIEDEAAKSPDEDSEQWQHRQSLEKCARWLQAEAEG